MKRFSPLLFLVLLLSNGLVLPSVAQSQAESDAPYIYYYSDILNSFVIERADGSDSRLIGEGLAPAFTDTILGPGWSPSGKWLAQIATERYRIVDTAHVPIVLSAHGDPLPFVDDYISAEMAWSPVDDVLLIGGVKGEFDPIFEPDAISATAPATLTFEMIDVDTQTVLAHFERTHEVYASRSLEFMTSVGYVGEPTIAWSTDGQQAVVRYLPERPTPEQSYDWNIVVLNRDGSIREVVQQIPGYDYSFGLVGYTTGIHAGKIGYDLDENRTTAVIEDLLEGERFEIVTDPGTAIRAYLNPVENTALLIVKPSDCTYPACRTDIWLWESEHDSMTLIIPDAPIIDTMEWSPDGQYALFIPRESSPYLLSMNPYSVNQLDEFGSLQRFVWLDDDTVRLIGGGLSSAVAHDIDLSSRTIVLTFPDELGHEADLFAGARWSPDGQEMAFVDDGLLILNTELEQMIEIRPDGRSWHSAPGGEAYWHPDGEWLFVADDASVTGGDARWMGIAKHDGTVRRDLNTCDDAACYGWLPENVNIDLLPEGQRYSVVPEPSRVLHGDSWCLYLSWSPDGEQIGCGSYSRLAMIFHVDTGEIDSELEGTLAFDNGGGIEWVLDDDEQYFPQMVELSTLKWADEEYSYIIGQSPDEALTVVDDSHTVNVYDTATEILIFSNELHYNYPHISFSPDGSLMVLGGNYVQVRLYDTSTWELITTLTTKATALAFSPDGQTLAVASSWDIQLWDVATLLENVDERSAE